MKKIIGAGKGGVGKTLTDAALSVYLASRGSKVCLVDTDGGHSMALTLGVERTLVPNTIEAVAEGLSLVVVEPIEYKSALGLKTKPREISIEEYLGQPAFRDDFGILAWADMIQHFFGVAVDFPTLSKFMVVVKTLHELEKSSYDYCIVDVEPTAGLERLLGCAGSMAQSLVNLGQQKGIIQSAIGIAWPDISAYLRGEYIGQTRMYASRMLSAVEALKAAEYVLVCLPERSPVEQLVEVAGMITRYGGSPSGIVVNNLRGDPHEEACLTRVRRIQQELGSDGLLPSVRIKHNDGLHGSEERIVILSEIGRKIARMLAIA